MTAEKQPPHAPPDEELRTVIHYTIVAVLGLIAGFILGSLFGHDADDSSAAGFRPGVSDGGPEAGSVLAHQEK